MVRWYKLLVLSLISGLLYAFSWYPHGVPFLIFFAWIPLLLISDALIENKTRRPFLKGWLYGFFAFLLWNTITTYWIGYCTVEGAIGAIVANALLQAIIFALWHSCRPHLPHQLLHPILLVALWISFEFLHLHWDLTWPWLNLGNVFAVCPRWVQWYSITGVFGGDLWIFMLNFCFYYIIKQKKISGIWSWRKALFALIILVIPCLLSALMYHYNQKHLSQNSPVEAVVIQQNTDPWIEEYHLTNEEQVQRLIDVGKPYITSRTNLVVCSESSIPHNLSLQEIIHGNYPEFNTGYNGFLLLDSVIRIYPHLNYILGLSTFEMYNKPISNTCRSIGQDIYVDVFNTACCYNSHRYNGHYHKSRLVPGVEKMPFPKLFSFLGDLIIQLGGSTSSLGTDTMQRTFSIDVQGETINVGTAICYESIYGELCGKFVRNGAQLLTIITNDSWWKDSQGHRQHFEMARLRAVESRCYVLRSANGGFSGVIDPMGNVLKKTKYDERTAFKAMVYPQNRKTFYVKHGDYLAHISVGAALLILLYSLIVRCISSIKKRKEP